MKLTYFKTKRTAPEPVFGTKGSACFDLKAFLEFNATVKGYSKDNVEFSQQVVGDRLTPKFYVYPGSRVLIPTGLIFDIPEGYSARLHPRSGNSFKKGLVLGNQEGVIDSDYVEPVFVIVYNISSKMLEISNGDKIAQAELVPMVYVDFHETIRRPKQKTDRSGGFGSTGK